MYLFNRIFNILNIYLSLKRLFKLLQLFRYNKQDNLLEINIIFWGSINGYYPFIFPIKFIIDLFIEDSISCSSLFERYYI